MKPESSSKSEPFPSDMAGDELSEFHLTLSGLPEFSPFQGEPIPEMRLPTGKPGAQEPPVRFEARGGVNPSRLPQRFKEASSPRAPY